MRSNFLGSERWLFMVGCTILSIPPPLETLGLIDIFPPDPHSHPVSLIEQKLGLTSTAIAVPFEPVAHTREGYCFQNVRDVAAERGGEIVYGWLVWQHDDLFVEAEHHAVWRKPTGEVVCITPQTPPEKAITFIADPSRTFNVDTEVRAHNIRVALADDPLLEEFFRVCEEQTDLFNAARLRCGKGPTIELNREETMQHLELEMWKTQIMNQVLNPPQTPMAKVGRNEPCPCGSGKKYKKCHGS